MRRLVLLILFLIIAILPLGYSGYSGSYLHTAEFCGKCHSMEKYVETFNVSPHGKIEPAYQCMACGKIVE